MKVLITKSWSILENFEIQKFKLFKAKTKREIVYNAKIYKDAAAYFSSSFRYTNEYLYV